MPQIFTSPRGFSSSKFNLTHGERLRNTSWGNIPWGMIVIALILSGIGVAALYSAAGGDWSPWAGKHLTRIAIGLGVMLVVAIIPLYYYKKLAPLGWVGIVLALLSLEFIGSGDGVSRWLSVGGFNVQPSELAKLAVIMCLAAYFSALNPELHRNPLIYIPALFIAGLPFALTILQPDLGTAVMMAGGGAAVIFTAGMPIWIIVFLVVLLCSAAPVIWISYLHDYQKDRIMTFLNPEANQLGAGYQITQSKIGLGSGGTFGKGYLNGSQSQLSYLPEKQTDFVFAMIGEEFGYIGSMVVLCLYMALVVLMLRASMRLSDRFARLMATGIATMIFLFVAVNIAMVTGLLPVVGAPLPLISYGGTAMLTVFIALGLMISAAIHDQGT